MLIYQIKKGCFFLHITTYYPPTIHAKQFHCPNCQVYAQQDWYRTVLHGTGIRVENLEVAWCQHCSQRSIWFKGSLLIPNNTLITPPHIDMPESIKLDYLEAASIATASPRGAASLLRLCLQKLMVELGEKGENINTDIASLVKKGLPVEVQQAFDTLRVVGNNAVHPGELDLSADVETAIAIFELINFIIEEQITKKKKIASLFDKLPAGAKAAIAKRDAK
ncbi:DUF4145 domain-containing protein [Bacillus albus]|nr:DUF4145 domain-containing protein [Bacillus albus]RXJ28644.1 DUF4145 domain-containing protein [Bacillus albus]RXJ33590.1 DUF4145 domain-containing protein [Bacillus albus]RXJ40826.1 DUF4145 domain-containing protein [Bacillus albus]RXJ57491.1 DUF4145 domain-containing protein [Bacillus albus]